MELPLLVHLSQESLQESSVLAIALYKCPMRAELCQRCLPCFCGGLNRRGRGGRRWEGMLGGDAMMHVKKLRLLQRKGDDISKSKLLEKTRKYLDVIGTRISALCSEEADTSAREDLHSDLWQVCAGRFPLIKR